jgi:hypothetical protein
MNRSIAAKKDVVYFHPTISTLSSAQWRGAWSKCQATHSPILLHNKATFHPDLRPTTHSPDSDGNVTATLLIFLSSPARGYPGRYSLAPIRWPRRWAKASRQFASWSFLAQSCRPMRPALSRNQLLGSLLVGETVTTRVDRREKLACGSDGSVTPTTARMLADFALSFCTAQCCFNAFQITLSGAAFAVDRLQHFLCPRMIEPSLETVRPQSHLTCPCGR